MKNTWWILLLIGAMPLAAGETEWSPVADKVLDGKPLEDLTINGRSYEVFQHENEAYPVFTNATTNHKLPWPDDLKSQADDDGLITIAGLKITAEPTTLTLTADN